MCNPMALALTVGGLNTYMSAKGQKDQADAQEQQQKLASQQERQRYLEEVTSLRSQEAQEQVARSQRLQEAELKGKEAKASAVVAAGEGGVAGLSVEALVANISRKEATYAFSERKQAEMIGIGRQMEIQSAGSGYQRNLFRINQPIPQPNYLGAFIEGAKTSASLYSSAQNAGATTPKQG